MTMTQRDAQALTYIAMRLREDIKGASKWDEHGTYSVVAKFIGQNLATSVEQVTRHAADVEAKTPGAITRPFLPAAPERDSRARPPKRTEECKKHPGQWATNCGGCNADRLAATYDDEEHDVTEPMTKAAALAAARVALGGEGL